MKTGRNDPCPCGSGAKYKKCCMGGVEGKAGMQGYDDRKSCAAKAVDILLRFARKVLPEESLYEAADDLGLRQLPDEAVQERLFTELFVPWFCYRWVPQADSSRLTIAERFLAEPGAGLDPRAERFIRAASAAPLWYWQVVDVVRGGGCVLRDMASGEEVFVTDVSSSGSLERWDILLCQVIRMDGINSFGAIGPYVLDPGRFRLNVEEFLAYLKVGEMGTAERLSSSMDFVAHYLDCVESMMKVAAPKIRNSDGDALVDIKAKYSFRSSDRGAIVAGLEKMQNVVRDEGATGDVFVWVVKDTIKAFIKLGAEDLTVECNSRRRERRIRERIEGALGGLVSYPVTEESEFDVGKAAEQPGTADDASGFDRLSPEQQLAVSEQIEARFMKWADEEVPMLNHKTPRQLVRSAKGKKRVAELINDWENQSHKMPDSWHRFDFNKLRKDLGIEPE